ncbi:MAG TPA: hypothetical protein VI911_10790 [Patescibacteria group bacterium]|nr:hypothetical protein [Patescibacteria group bacterium]
MKIKDKKLELTMQEFYTEMYNRLAKKEKEGKRGWAGKIPPLSDLITEMAVDVQKYRNGAHSHQKLSLDIANRAMMVWYRAKKLELRRKKAGVV